MNIDHLFQRRYDENVYNCAHFCRDVWLYVTGEDISNKILPICSANINVTGVRTVRRNFKRIAEPKNICIILMRGSKNNLHIGVVIENRVLHITELGVECLPIDVAVRGFSSFYFYV